MTAVLQLPDARESERHRRSLLHEADRLLTEVEELRLAERRRVPTELLLAVRALQAEVGRLEKAPLRPTVQAVHEAIFGIQQRLMAANPRRQGVRSHLGRAVGSPVIEPIREGVSWKLLVLPPQPTAPEHEPGWRDLVAATVERALDRWCYAQHNAVRAARRGEGAVAAVTVARVAWNNYWELTEEAGRVNRPAAG